MNPMSHRAVTEDRNLVRQHVDQTLQLASAMDPSNGNQGEESTVPAEKSASPQADVPEPVTTAESVKTASDPVVPDPLIVTV